MIYDGINTSCIRLIRNRFVCVYLRNCVFTFIYWWRSQTQKRGRRVDIEKEKIMVFTIIQKIRTSFSWQLTVKLPSVRTCISNVFSSINEPNILPPLLIKNAKIKCFAEHQKLQKNHCYEQDFRGIEVMDIFITLLSTYFWHHMAGHNLILVLW